MNCLKLKTNIRESSFGGILLRFFLVTLDFFTVFKFIEKLKKMTRVYICLFNQNCFILAPFVYLFSICVFFLFTRWV